MQRPNVTLSSEASPEISSQQHAHHFPPAYLLEHPSHVIPGPNWNPDGSIKIIHVVFGCVLQQSASTVTRCGHRACVGQHRGARTSATSPTQSLKETCNHLPTASGMCHLLQAPPQAKAIHPALTKAPPQQAVRPHTAHVMHQAWACQVLSHINKAISCRR